jgi:hypothetical protein
MERLMDDPLILRLLAIYFGSFLMAGSACAIACIFTENTHPTIDRMLNRIAVYSVVVMMASGIAAGIVALDHYL